MADIADQIRDVAEDLPLFFVTPLMRHWHRTWGATVDEVAADMPGDELLPRAHYCCTRAITVDAPVEAVWPWLIQVGWSRGGWYADDLLDNFARPSARQVVPQLQDLHVGQWLRMMPHASERTAFKVDSFVRDSWLLWRTPNRTWSWRLVPSGQARTRLITRIRTRYEWRRPLTPLTVLLMEVADYPMMRRMLRGIRDRAREHYQLSMAPRSKGALSC